MHYCLELEDISSQMKLFMGKTRGDGGDLSTLTKSIVVPEMPKNTFLKNGENKMMLHICDQKDR